MVQEIQHNILEGTNVKLNFPEQWLIDNEKQTKPGMTVQSEVQQLA
jgi:hypothetical protein